jgi:carbon-monoxide dehydrogenase medium subunit
MPHIAHPAIRNRGTIGGSVAYADPAAELPACLVALGAEIEIAGKGGKRAVKAGDFFKSLFETALGAHDVLTAIRFPAADAGTRVGFAELARRTGTAGVPSEACRANQGHRHGRQVRIAELARRTGTAGVPSEACRANQGHRHGRRVRIAELARRTGKAAKA